MLKTIIWVLLLLGVISFWTRHQSKGASPPHWGSSRRTIVIKYKDPQDLLAQLRRVKKGQDVEFDGSGQVERTLSTGIPCSDKAAIAAFKAKVRDEEEQMNQALNAELKRIQSAR